MWTPVKMETCAHLLRWKHVNTCYGGDTGTPPVMARHRNTTCYGGDTGTPPVMVETQEHRLWWDTTCYGGDTWTPVMMETHTCCTPVMWRHRNTMSPDIPVMETREHLLWWRHMNTCYDGEHVNTCSIDGDMWTPVMMETHMLWWNMCSHVMMETCEHLLWWRHVNTCYDGDTMLTGEHTCYDGDMWTHLNMCSHVNTCIRWRHVNTC